MYTAASGVKLTDIERLEARLIGTQKIYFIIDYVALIRQKRHYDIKIIILCLDNPPSSRVLRQIVTSPNVMKAT